MVSKMGRGFCSRALLVCLGCLPVVCAQTNVPLPAPPAHHYLFVIETSKTMQRRAQATLQTVQAVLNSRFGGQLRQGDLVGMCAYNQSITQAAPFERWDPQTQVSQHLTNFLRAQKYENDGRIETLWPAVKRCVDDFSEVTIILICAGENKLAGTPFDRQINQAWQQWRDDQQKARMPIVTLFRAVNGEIVNWSVTPAPWPVEFALAAQPAASAQVEPTRAAPAFSNTAPQRSGTKKPEFAPLPVAAVTNLVSRPLANLQSMTNPPSTSLTAKVVGISSVAAIPAIQQTNLPDPPSPASLTARVTTVSNPEPPIAVQQTNNPHAPPPPASLQNRAATTDSPMAIPLTLPTTNRTDATAPSPKTEAASSPAPQPLPLASRASPSSVPMEVMYIPSKDVGSLAYLPADTQPSDLTQGTETAAKGDPVGGDTTASDTASAPQPGAPPARELAKLAMAVPSAPPAGADPVGSPGPTTNSEPQPKQKLRLSVRHLAVLVLFIMAATGSVFCFFMYAKSRSRVRQRVSLFPRELAGGPPPQSPPATEQQKPAGTPAESQPFSGVRPSPGAATSEKAGASVEADSTKQAEPAAPEGGRTPLDTATGSPAPAPSEASLPRSEPSQPSNPPPHAEQS